MKTVTTPRTLTTAHSSPRINLAAVVMAIVSILICLGSCSPEQTSYCEFRSLPNDGWFSTMPVRFQPELTDSTAQAYNLEIALRHNNTYPYRNFSLVVDLIGNGSVKRREVKTELADGYGNWKGTGFGALYQIKVPVGTIQACDSIKHIVLWQSMRDCDCITGIENVGVIITPVK